MQILSRKHLEKPEFIENSSVLDWDKAYKFNSQNYQTDLEFEDGKIARAIFTNNYEKEV